MLCYYSGYFAINSPLFVSIEAFDYSLLGLLVYTLAQFAPTWGAGADVAIDFHLMCTNWKGLTMVNVLLTLLLNFFPLSRSSSCPFLKMFPFFIIV